MSAAGSAGRAETVHATCVVLGTDGVLIRGPSGRGKSTLARTLLAAGERARTPARLVGDDRVRLAAESGRLVARPHPAIAGLMEVRGLGIVEVPYATSCEVTLVIDLLADGNGALQAEDVVELLGIACPRVAVERGRAALAAGRRLRVLNDTAMTNR